VNYGNSFRLFHQFSTVSGFIQYWINSEKLMSSQKYIGSFHFLNQSVAETPKTRTKRLNFGLSPKSGAEINQ